MRQHAHRVKLDTGVTSVTKVAAKGVCQEHVIRITETVQPASLATGGIDVISGADIVPQDHVIKAMGNVYSVQLDTGVTIVTRIVVKIVSHVNDLMDIVHPAILDIGVIDVKTNAT